MTRRESPAIATHRKALPQVGVVLAPLLRHRVGHERGHNSRPGPAPPHPHGQPPQVLQARRPRRCAAPWWPYRQRPRRAGGRGAGRLALGTGASTASPLTASRDEPVDAPAAHDADRLRVVGRPTADRRSRHDGRVPGASCGDHRSVRVAVSRARPSTGVHRHRQRARAAAGRGGREPRSMGVQRRRPTTANEGFKPDTTSARAYRLRAPRCAALESA